MSIDKNNAGRLLFTGDVDILYYSDNKPHYTYYHLLQKEVEIMNRKMQKILSIVLTLCMLLSNVPVRAMAAETAEETTTKYSVQRYLVPVLVFRVCAPSA